MSKTKLEQDSPAPAEALGGEEFAALMRQAGIDADTPVAVAVSGGPDSMALALLAGAWAAKAAEDGCANGEIHFLTFDHGLRGESAGEARQTGAWLAARGFDHHILNWPETLAKPVSDLQAVARGARYKALEAWCAAHDVAVLLLAHHLEDQAETLLMRLARGSGVDGLSAMAKNAPPLTGQDRLRLVRPLLGIAKSRLVATLTARGQDWLEDPSNRDRSYLRVQARELLREMPLEGLTPARLAATARRMARVRVLLDDQTAKLLDTSVRLQAAGYAELDTKALLGACRDASDGAYEEIMLRVLSRLIASVGGRAYPPRLEGVERLLTELQSGDFSGATLAGCLFAPTGKDNRYFLVAREVGTTGESYDIIAGEKILWDGRFAIEAETGGNIAALGDAGWRALLGLWPTARKTPIPHAARLALPTLRVDGCIKAVPHLAYSEQGFKGFRAAFSPQRPLYPGRA